MVFSQHKQTKEDLLWRLRENNSQNFRHLRTDCETPRNSEGKKKKKNLEKENQPFHPDHIQHPRVSGSTVTDTALQVL